MAPMSGKQTVSKSKSKGEEKSLDKYITGGEEIWRRGLEKIIMEIEVLRKEMREEMEGMKEQMIEKRKAREEERKREKEEWRREKKILEKRIVALEWINEKKERKDKKNDIVIKGVNWEREKLEQEVEKYIKDSLKVNIVVKKANRIELNGNRNLVIAEIDRWEQKREIMSKKKELRRGITNKCEETWEYLEEFDIIGLTETWVEEGTWKKISNRLSNKYEWKCIPATRENIKGRARGGIITAISKDLKEVKVREINKGAMETNLIYNKNRWRVITLYSQNIEETLEKLMEFLPLKEEKEEYLMIGGDFNARTEEEGGPIRTGEKEEEELRRSKDKVVNKEGRIMINKIKERGWMILNGSYEKEGEWTYIEEMGPSVIDYVVMNEKAIEEVKKIEEGNRTESDHIPVEGELEGIERRNRKRSDRIEIERSVWTEEGIEYYHEKCEGWTCTQTKNGEIWREIENKVNNSILKIRKKIIPWKIGRREWHSKEWREKKRELRKELRRMKKGKINREEYIGKRREYKIWCDNEKKKHEKEEEKKIKLIRTEEKAWKYINKYRKKREKIDENIDLESWNSHFMELLGGTKERRIMEEDRREEEGIGKNKQEVEEITKEELMKQLKRLKRGKAPGENGIENEAWRLMPKEIREVFLKLLNKIWKEGRMPEEWNKGLISPIYKKGEKRDVRNYRGVTLMDTAKLHN
ncbi:golgin subfamily A member 6-like protein 22 [Polyergus mexicanus]|uniref:golgin subfamily A member 6-like protein 22 n=1 Tax=Polyergus mexicanus TaxID=615972 RepID=UPI0038B62E86